MQPAARNRTLGTSNPTGRHRRLAWIAAVVGLVTVIAAVALSTANEPEAEGPPVPDLQLPGFDGGTVRLAEFRGRPLVVNFWASWCFPCLDEMPGFERVYQQHRDTVAFLGINLADDPATAQLVREQTGITYPVAKDPDGTAFKAFGGFGMPTTVFISSEGTILELHTGELSADALAARIDRYFGSG